NRAAAGGRESGPAAREVKANRPKAGAAPTKTKPNAPAVGRAERPLKKEGRSAARSGRLRAGLLAVLRASAGTADPAARRTASWHPVGPGRPSGAPRGRRRPARWR